MLEMTTREIHQRCRDLATEAVRIMMRDPIVRRCECFGVHITCAMTVDIAAALLKHAAERTTFDDIRAATVRPVYPTA